MGGAGVGDGGEGDGVGGSSGRRGALPDMWFLDTMTADMSYPV